MVALVPSSLGHTMSVSDPQNRQLFCLTCGRLGGGGETGSPWVSGVNCIQGRKGPNVSWKEKHLPA